MKKKTNQIEQFMKGNKLIFVLFVLYVAFHSFFEKIITSLFVDTFLCYLQSSWYVDIFGIFIFVSIIYSFIKSKKINSSISNQIFIVSILLFIIVGYYRISNNIWTFTPMYFCKTIKYVDLILIFCLSNILTYFCHKSKKYDYTVEKGFLFDNPIQKITDDKLKRNEVAEKLVDKIKNTANFNAAFAIGICSEWGHGKTSFLNLIEENLGDDGNRIIVKFNPWLNNDENGIIASFFDELSRKLKPYNRELSNDLIEYAEILNTFSGGTTKNFINFFKTKHSNTLKEKFDAINCKIQNSGKQIIVFIDDLDRLYEKELVEVLRLVRNSANFANTVFVVAYDKNYLISALEQINGYHSNFYLEKIFQLEIILPKFENYIIAQHLKKVILPFLTDMDKQELEQLLKGRHYEKRFNYSLIANIRDINRFVNSFLLSYELLKGEIDLLDLLNLELLRIKYLGVYNLLSKDYSDFLESAKKYTNDKISYLCLKNLRENNDKDKILDKTILEEYLETHYIDVGIQKNQISDVLRYVTNIFSVYKSNIYHTPNYSLLSITNSIAIDRYFHYNLLNSNLSEIEFSKYRQKSEKEFQDKINEWSHNGLYQEVDNRLERIEFFQNKEDYEKIINSIFFYASIPTSDGRVLGFDYDSLMSKLSYNDKVEGFYTQEEFHSFIKELFQKQKPPYLFVSDFINNSFKESAFSWGFELSKEELIEQKLYYFQQYAESIASIDKYFFWLYHYCGYTEWVDSGNSRRSAQEIAPLQDAKNIFKNCAKRLIDNFLKNIITKRVNINDMHDIKSKKICYSITNVVFNVWESWENFEKFLLEFDEQKVPNLKEFKDFFSKCKEVNFERYIEYEFKEIDLTNALLLNN
ncbi:MAG: KAP family NTPase [Prevotellaceae bacterium]|nr:KAP family NTPase [Prevotellaceae bacterium]